MIQAVKATPLRDEFIDALHARQLEGQDLLPKPARHQVPDETVKSIAEYVDHLLAGNRPEKDLHEYALQLGALWGHMVEKAYGWRWQHLEFDDESQGIYLVSPHAWYRFPPLHFLNRILSGKNNNTVMDLFSMMDNIENNPPQKPYQIIA